MYGTRSIVWPRKKLRRVYQNKLRQALEKRLLWQEQRTYRKLCGMRAYWAVTQIKVVMKQQSKHRMVQEPLFSKHPILPSNALRRENLHVQNETSRSVHMVML